MVLVVFCISFLVVRLKISDMVMLIVVVIVVVNSSVFSVSVEILFSDEVLCSFDIVFRIVIKISGIMIICNSCI